MHVPAIGASTESAAPNDGRASGPFECHEDVTGGGERNGQPERAAREYAGASALDAVLRDHLNRVNGEPPVVYIAGCRGRPAPPPPRAPPPPTCPCPPPAAGAFPALPIAPCPPPDTTPVPDAADPAAPLGDPTPEP